MELNKQISIIIADDHSFFRSGLQQVLAYTGAYNLVGEAADGEELITLVKDLEPDLVIADIGMPKLNGIEATKIIYSSNLKTKVIGLSMHTEESIILEMMVAGAMGFMEKNIVKEDLYEAIESVVIDNQFYFPSSTSERLIEMIQECGYRPFPVQKALFTERELEVIHLTCKEFSNKEIADKLELSKRTIETHRVRIMEKMRVKTVAGLVAYAFTNGIVKG